MNTVDHTDGFVLRAVDYGERDRILTLFTERFGRVDGLAKGCRGSQRRFQGGLEPFHRLRVDVGPGRGSGLWRVRSARVVAQYVGLLGDLSRLQAAGEVVNLVRRVTVPEQPEPVVFAWLDAAFSALAQGGNRAAVLTRFRLGLAAALGLLPQVDRCGRCGRPVPAHRAAAFDARQGSVICQDCGGAPVILSGEALALVNTVTAVGGISPAAVLAQEPLGGEAEHNLDRATVSFLEYRIG